MGQPYVGEIRIFAGNFPPNGWMFCDGQLLAISENDVLFNLIGTTYGGDGQSTFALPDLRGRVPLHQGSNGSSSYTLAENGGVEQVTLSTNQIPVHTHPQISVIGPATANKGAAGLVLADTGPAGQTQLLTYAPNDSANQVQLAANTIAPQGGSQPHSNLQPLLAVNFILSLFGIFPSPT